MPNQVCVMTIRVRNLAESIDFYKSVLGFEVDQYYGDTIASLKHANTPLILEEHSTLDSSNNVVLALQSDNIDEDVTNMKANGVTFLHDPKPCPPGRYATFTDLNGYQFELLEFAKVNK